MAPTHVPLEFLETAGYGLFCPGLFITGGAYGTYMGDGGGWFKAWARVSSDTEAAKFSLLGLLRGDALFLFSFSFFLLFSQRCIALETVCLGLPRLGCRQPKGL